MQLLKTLLTYQLLKNAAENIGVKKNSITMDCAKCSLNISHYPRKSCILAKCSLSGCAVVRMYISSCVYTCDINS